MLIRNESSTSDCAVRSSDACTRASHEALKADVERFCRTVVGPCAWPEGELYMGRCPRCDSSLAVPLADAVAAGVL